MSLRSSRVLLNSLKNKHCICYLTNFGNCIRKQPFSVNKYKIIPALQCEKFSHVSDCPPKCWQCNFPHKSDLFCSKCKALQKLPEDLNYFDIIGVENNFNITKEELQKKYRQLQALLHPDRYGQKSEEEKKISENLSSLVNKAYSTLLNPLDRGLYMLKLQNISIPEETSSSDPKFLMEIMEKNEEVEEASANSGKILDLLKQNQSAVELLTRQLADEFTNKNYEAAKKLLIKMKYYFSIDSRLQKLKQDLGIVQ